MQPVVFKVALFRGDFDQARSQYALLWMMEALVRINQSHIRQFRKLTQDKKVPAPYPLIYRSGVHYEPEAGTEEWVDIPNILDVRGGTFPGPWGDCIPLTSLVLRDDYKTIPFGQIEKGMKIAGDGDWTTVTEFAVTGEKPIMVFHLSNDRMFRCSPEHRLFTHDGHEVRAREVRTGTRMLCSGPFGIRPDVQVLRIMDGGREICGDITTDTGRFQMAESGLIVHNCEDLACWRAAELREDPHHPIKAKPFAKWRRKDDGAYAYHAIVLLPNGQLEDPSLVLGMGNEPEFARLHMAERYKEGTLTPSVRFAKTPDVMVVDQSKPGGFAGKKDILKAKAATGLLAKPIQYVDRPPPGALISNDIVTGRIAKGSALDFPVEGRMPRSDEDGSVTAPGRGPNDDKLYRGIQGEALAAWGFDKHRMLPVEQKLLRNGGEFRRVPGERNAWAIAPRPNHRMIRG